METNHYQFIKDQIEYYSSKPLREQYFLLSKMRSLKGYYCLETV
jgi:hypothetical protein